MVIYFYKDSVAISDSSPFFCPPPPFNSDIFFSGQISSRLLGLVFPLKRVLQMTPNRLPFLSILGYAKAVSSQQETNSLCYQETFPSQHKTSE